MFALNQCIFFQLHIKIKQDLQGLVGSMTNMFNGGQPKDSGVAQPHLPQISQPSFKLKMPSLPQAAGKPPVSLFKSFT